MTGEMLACGISVIALLVVLAMVPVLAQPTADSFGVNDASGDPGTYVIVPVEITNAANGPIETVVFDITYDKNVINVTSALRSELTSNWNVVGFNDFSWGSRVVVSTGQIAQAIPDGSNGSVMLLNFRVVGGEPYETSMNLSDIQLSDPDGKEGTAPAKNGMFYVNRTIFDTDRGTYPSISGIHVGTITPDRNITVHKLYTYSCEGTGGHTESVWIQGNGVNETASWNGYTGDYQTIDFNNPFILREGIRYNYTIKTGSYPQIVHEHSKHVSGGEINCTTFTDANGRIYDDWIPAIMFI